MNEFEGRAGIIVGGGQGVGRAAALSLARLGAQLLIVDVGCTVDGSGSDPDVARRVASEIELAGGKAQALVLDCTGSARALVDTAQALLPSLDFGVYCAGFHHERALLREAEADLERVLAVHLLGAIGFTRELARNMVAARRPGRVVLATSACAFTGSAGQSAQAAAAGGLVAFVRSAAAELRRQGVRINAIVPTARTRLTEGLPLFESIRSDSLTPEHAAQLVCHLVSDAAEEVHGEVVGVAGGRIYAFRQLETPGAFHEGGPADLPSISASWREVTRR